MTIANTEKKFASELHSSFSASTEFEVCSCNSWIFGDSYCQPNTLVFSEHQLSVFPRHAKIGDLGEMCVNVHCIGVSVL